MLAPTQVALDTELVKSLQEVAAERRAKLQREAEAFEALHAELKSKYLGPHVAIHNRELVDHDPDALALLRRVRARYGDAPVLFCQVGPEPDKEYVIRSPRLERWVALHLNVESVACR